MRQIEKLPQIKMISEYRDLLCVSNLHWYSNIHYWWFIYGI